MSNKIPTDLQWADLVSRIKAKADAADVPTNTSDLTNDSNFVSDASYVHTDANFTTTLKTKLEGLDENAEANTIEAVKVNNTALTPDANKAVNITVPTTAADVNALADTTKYGASFALELNESTYVITATLKDQNGDTLGAAQTIDLPLESVVVSGSYDAANKKVVLTLKDGSTVDFSVADLVAGLQTEITSSNKLNADLVDDAISTHKFTSADEKAAWNGKQDALTAGANITITGSTISATDTTYSAFTGASDSSDGAMGLVPAPSKGDESKYLRADGAWANATYNLPIASANALGGVKVGANLTIEASTGVLSADAQVEEFTNPEWNALWA